MYRLSEMIGLSFPYKSQLKYFTSKADPLGNEIIKHRIAE
ncbi:unnamed protein product [marine sediment metagenome]|uniref:Uncharacterized protein n=1 Tax=marine sediment metagenome TaxID=412755 RepID=X1GQL1_9ZZZZ